MTTFAVYVIVVHTKRVLINYVTAELQIIIYRDCTRTRASARSRAFALRQKLMFIANRADIALAESRSCNGL